MLLFAAALVAVSSCGGGSDAATDRAAEAAEESAGGEASPSDTSPPVEQPAPSDTAPSDTASTAVDGSGGGTLVVDGVVYTFTNELCFTAPNNISLQGPAASDGEFGDAWISISADSNEDYDDDGVADTTADVTIEHGKTDLDGDGDSTQPDLFAARLSFSTQPEGINEGVLLFEISSGTISGSGELSDSNGVLVPFGETVPFTFEASCV